MVTWLLQLWIVRRIEALEYALGQCLCGARLALIHNCAHLPQMQEFLTQLWDFQIWTVVAIAGAMVAVVSIIADRRRHRRTNMENVGFMPWTGISVLSIMVTLLSTALAIKAG